MKGLIIKEPYIDFILDGIKPWEIRGSNTKNKGRIALIKSGTGRIYGTVELTDCFNLDAVTFTQNKDKHRLEKYSDVLDMYSNPKVWEMKNPVKLDNPVPYIHKQGCQTWVNLPDDILNNTDSDFLNDLRVLVAAGKAKGKTAYESLKESLHIKGVEEFL